MVTKVLESATVIENAMIVNENRAAKRMCREMDFKVRVINMEMLRNNFFKNHALIMLSTTGTCIN